MSNRRDDDDHPLLQVIFHSATHLPKPPLSFKPGKPYVTACILSPDIEPNWVKTLTDENGGENPVWDYEIRLPLDQQKLLIPGNFYLFIKIMHSGTALGDREIGHVKLRLPTLLAGGESIGYPVVVSGGEERGRIVISHKLLTTPVPPMGVKLLFHFHCAIDLPHPLFNSNGSPYVKVAIVGLDAKPNWVKTVTDENGGENPVWDYTIQLQLNPEKVLMARNFSVVCKIKHSGKHLGNREIGRVKVGLQDFLAGSATGENIHYPVVSGGVEKGTIVISHRLVTGGDVTASPPPTGTVDPNGGNAGGGGMRVGVRIAATATTVGAAIYGVVAELT